VLYFSSPDADCRAFCVPCRFLIKPRAPDKAGSGTTEVNFTSTGANQGGAGARWRADRHEMLSPYGCKGTFSSSTSEIIQAVRRLLRTSCPSLICSRGDTVRQRADRQRGGVLVDGSCDVASDERDGGVAAKDSEGRKRPLDDEPDKTEPKEMGHLCFFTIERFRASLIPTRRCNDTT
jgi:hypothetical protein